jgi:hypothetical protein
MKYQYLAPQAHERYNGCLPHRVLTPDGGVIFCVTEADANRICDDMNALCQYIVDLEYSDANAPSWLVETIVDAFDSRPV